MPRRVPTIPKWLIAAAPLAAVLLLDVISPVGLAMMSPALALFTVIALGLFTGERSVAWLRRAVRRWRRPRPADAPVAAPASVVRVFAVGATRAFALAMRPPPHALLSR